jgi:hypothetical protein
VGILPKASGFSHPSSQKVWDAWQEWMAERQSEQTAKLRKERLRAAPWRKVHARIAKQINGFLSGERTRRTAIEMLGYTPEELIRHLERQFLPGMGWHNRAEWHIDHIVPLVSFKLHEVKAAWALSNLRPLWVKENLSKSGKRVFLL